MAQRTVLVLTALAVSRLLMVPVSLMGGESEEQVSVPVGAGDGLGDGGEGSVGLAVVFEAVRQHRHGDLLAAVLAGEQPCRGSAGARPWAGSAHPVPSNARRGYAANRECLRSAGA